MEGFGLPIIESLIHGKPCICSSRGALGESAHGGGCLIVDPIDAGQLATAMKELLSQPIRLQELVLAARSRKFKTWADYGNELIEWLRTLRHRG